MRIVLILLLFLFGCSIHTCPPEDAYFLVTFSSGKPGMVKVDKGYFNDKDGWVTQKELEQMYQRYLLESGTRVEMK